ncbi:MAG: adenylate/guanylate cyclase domain-containing protein [Acidimicrobiales bacterium]
MSDGARLEFGPNDVYEIPPGHDGYVIGDEPCIQIEWSGLRAFTGFYLAGIANRTLATILFTDVVDSTTLVSELGDAAWRELLSRHLESMRLELDRYRGYEINTTGDGLIATFEAPAAALQCAAAIGRASARQGLKIRASVHVGEVELVGTDIRGVAVHEGARILGEAEDAEILVSAAARALTRFPASAFEDRGTHTLKGLNGEWELFSYIKDGAE